MKQLITFLAFAKEGSYNRVSQKLNYSVSTLVSHISSLENEFHVELVQSQGRKSFLTPAGQAFLPCAQEMVDLYHETIAQMSAFEGISGRLQVAVSEMVGLSSLAPVYALFSKNNPQIQMTIRVNSTGSCKQQLLNNSADVVFLQDFFPLDNGRITSVPLYDEPVVLVAPPSHPLGRKASVRPDDLRHQALLFPRNDYIQHPTLKAALQTCEFTPSDNLFLESGLLLRQTVKDRRCLAFLPLSSVESELAQKSLIRLPWAGEEIFMTVYAMYDIHSMALPAIQGLVAFVQSVIDHRA